MNDGEEELKILKQKAKYYYESSKAVHISFKKGYWKNGFIQEIGADFLVMIDFKDGEVPVFFLEVKNIDQFNAVSKTEVKT